MTEASHPRVSVVLTSYNHGKYLRQAIDSVLAQTFQDFELTIWDDASTDDSWNIIQSYTDPRIRAFRNETNQRKLVNKALASGALRGEFVAIHHSDDTWHPLKLERQVQVLNEHDGIGAVFTHAHPIDEEGQLLSDATHNYFAIFDHPNRPRHAWLRHFLLEGNALCHPSALIRRRCFAQVGDYRYNLLQLPDLDMWIRICLQADIHIVQERLTYFRVRDNEANTSGNTPANLNRINCELQQILPNYLQITDVDLFLRAFPEAARYPDLTPADLPFAFALTVLSITPAIPPKLFALQVIHQHFGDVQRHPRLLQCFGYDLGRFIADTGAYDFFNEQLLDARLQLLRQQESTIHEQARTIMDRDATIVDLGHRVDVLQTEVNLMLGSRSWAITRPLRTVTEWWAARRGHH
ncbi:MAG: glycosyltransferase [Burkholderiaceae bacterium]